MRTDLAVALGFLAVLLVIRFIYRRTATGRMHALMTDSRDDPVAKQQLEELMVEEGANEATRRTKLWAEAPTSLRSARQLQRILEEDLKGNEEVRRFVGERQPPDTQATQELDRDRQDVQQQLERVKELIRQLRA